MNEGELIDPLVAELSEVMEAMLAKIELRAASHEFMASRLFIPQAEGDDEFLALPAVEGKNTPQGDDEADEIGVVLKALCCGMSKGEKGAKCFESV